MANEVTDKGNWLIVMTYC